PDRHRLYAVYQGRLRRNSPARREHYRLYRAAPESRVGFPFYRRKAVELGNSRRYRDNRDSRRSYSYQRPKAKDGELIPYPQAFCLNEATDKAYSVISCANNIRNSGLLLLYSHWLPEKAIIGQLEKNI